MEQLGQVLLASGLVSDLVAALARQIGLPCVDLTDQTVDGAAVATVPGAVCRRLALLPVGFDGARLVLAMADPANAFALDDVRPITGLEVGCVVATKADVLAALDRCNRPGRGARRRCARTGWPRRPRA